MRIISQDGTIDMPYERMIVQIQANNEKSIIAYDTMMLECEFMCMGVYSTPEKAQKAMEMLRNKYAEYLSTDGGALATVNFYIQPNVWNIPKVFKFPQDGEVK